MNQAIRGTNDAPALHHVGSNVAETLGLHANELTAIAPQKHLPDWTSSLQVQEIAYDSVALSSLAISLIGIDRGIARFHQHSIQPDSSRIQSSFGSDKLFRMDGAAPDVWASLSGFWRVSNGWVRTHGNYPHHAERLARLLGISSQAERPEVEQAFHHWSRFELERQAAEAGALVIAVRDPAEWRHHPQYQVLEHTPIVHFASHGNAAPRSWIGPSTRPLSGIRVLDFTRVIAGPVATRDLAIAGADVLRVDSPHLPEMTWQHLDTGQEKRSTLLNLDAPSDFETLQRLLEEADVIVHGYRPSALARYGLDLESLHLRFPGIVVAQLSAWGTQGPWGDHRGFDSLVQAATGIAILESGDGGSTPGALPVQALDHSAGHILAASITTAIRAQRQDGGSFEINIHLARIAHELLAAGPSNVSIGSNLGTDVFTTTLPVNSRNTDTPTLVECAPPVLSFEGAPTEYPSNLHPWGSDQPIWLT